MDLQRSVRAVAGASGNGSGGVDWDAVVTAARAATDAGSLELTDAERAGYAADVRDARDRLRSVGGLAFDVPETVEVQNRHHWIDANAATFERVMRPVESGVTGVFPGTVRMLNTGTMSVALAFLGTNVLGQYDPLLLADGDNEGQSPSGNRPSAGDSERRSLSGNRASPDDSGGRSPPSNRPLPGDSEGGSPSGNRASPGDSEVRRASNAGDDHGLYFVHPNIVAAAAGLGVEYPRFRRWIAFHEVAHAAEFGAAPWLSDHLESRMESAMETLSAGGFDREALRDLDTAMTAVEGYAELLMDRAFDAEYADLRAKLDARRQGGGPVSQVIRRLLGLGMKRRQYERGARFFRNVADQRNVAAAGAVWEAPANLPTDAELDDPAQWLARVDP